MDSIMSKFSAVKGIFLLVVSGAQFSYFRSHSPDKYLVLLIFFQAQPKTAQAKQKAPRAAPTAKPRVGGKR